MQKQLLDGFFREHRKIKIFIFSSCNFFEKKFFQELILRALEKHFFSKFLNCNTSAFIRTFKCSKILKIGCSNRIWNLVIFRILEVLRGPNLENHEKSKFSSALIEKTKSRMKKFSRTKNAQNHPKNWFFWVRSCKNNFLMDILAKIEKSKISIFWKFFSRFFKNSCYKRLKKNFFFIFGKYNVSAFIRTLIH